MQKNKHGGRRSNQTGRPKVAPEKKRKIQVPLKVNEGERLAIDFARSDLSIADFVVLCSSGKFRDAVLSDGWDSIPEFIAALASGAVKMPTRPPEMPSGEMY